jgi:hypothetical protein
LVLVVVLGLLPFVIYVPLMRRTGRAVVEDDRVKFIGGVRVGNRRLTWPVASYELTQDAVIVRTRRWLTAKPSRLVIARRLLNSVPVTQRRTPFTRGLAFDHPTAGRVEIWPGNPNDFHRYWTELGWPTPN